MIYKRHKWGGRLGSRAKENSSVGCVQCGCVRQYVGGIPTYFVASEDRVYDKYAPVCNSDNLAAVRANEDHSNSNNPKYISL